jgi:hypothetical protein
VRLLKYKLDDREIVLFFVRETHYTRTADKMSALLNGKILGASTEGKAWALKALHPAAPELSLAGVPSRESNPIVLQNYAQSIQINPPSGAVGSWGFDAIFPAHPVFQGAVSIADASAAHTNFIAITNPQLGNGITASVNGLTNSCEQYRMAYFGITGYHDSSATGNEGTLAVAQYAQCPSYFSTTGATGTCTALCEEWPDLPRTFTQLQSMPNAYLSNAREGFYAPSKLSEEAFRWKSSNDLVTHFTTLWSQAQPVVNALPGLSSSVASFTPVVPGTNAQSFPYGLTSTTISGATIAGPQQAVHRRCDNNVVHVSVRNLDLTASFTFYLRMGLEMRVLPASSLSSLQRFPPSQDIQAMEAYFAVSRELKDGYPSDFNDLGKILKDIGGVLMDVMPVVMPQLAPFIAAGKGAYKTINGSGLTVNREAIGKVRFSKPQVVSAQQMKPRSNYTGARKKKGPAKTPVPIPRDAKSPGYVKMMARKLNILRPVK